MKVIHTKTTKEKHNVLRAIWATLREKGLTEEKESLVHQFTAGRTASMRQMNSQELRRLLYALKSTHTSPEEALKDRMRKGLIACFYSMGKSVQDAKNWAEQHGASSIKKTFNAYNIKELKHLLLAAEKMLTESKNKHMKIK